jgi:hypothetical protein
VFGSESSICVTSRMKGSPTDTSLLYFSQNMASTMGNIRVSNINSSLVKEVSTNNGRRSRVHGGGGNIDSCIYDTI